LFISAPRFGRRGTPGIHPARPIPGPPGPDIGTTHPDPPVLGGKSGLPPDPPDPIRETNQKRRRKRALHNPVILDP
jgi:hypothetical protein